MKRRLVLFLLVLPTIVILQGHAQDSNQPRQIPLPTSKMLNSPAIGRLGPVNSFPATFAVSPDGRYAALLNDGYGTEAAHLRQSITILDLKSSRLRDFPDKRFSEHAHQSLFLGLAYSSDGHHLYASVASITDPTGAKSGDTGNGIAVYRFKKGKLHLERFIKVGLQRISTEKRVASALRAPVEGTAIPYPAGIAVVHAEHGDGLLVANNLSDNVVLLDANDGHVVEQFDLSTQPHIPSSFPYTVVATRDGRRAWCSLWNASQVAELDLVSGRIARWISFLKPGSETLPGSHPTAMLLSPDEKILYVTLGDAAIDHRSGRQPSDQRHSRLKTPTFGPTPGTGRQLSQRVGGVGGWQDFVCRGRRAQCGRRL